MNIQERLEKYINPNKLPFFICVGSALHSYDMVGPYIGSKLKEAGFRVLGTLDEPLHAKNLGEYEETIRYYSEDIICSNLYQIIAIDAIITGDDYPYNIFSEPLRPGAGVGKDIYPIGSSKIVVNPFYDSHIKNHSYLVMRFLLESVSEKAKKKMKLLGDNVFNEIIKYYNNLDEKQQKVQLTLKQTELIMGTDESLENIASFLGCSRHTIYKYVRNILPNVNKTLYKILLHELQNRIERREAYFHVR